MNSRPAIGEWEQRFVLELRSRDLDGPRIGELLADVQSHCTDTDETPEQAFGDPAAYARSRTDDAPRTPVWRTAAQAAAGSAGFLGFITAVGALADDRSAELTRGMFGFVALATVGVPLLINTGRHRGTSALWQALFWTLVIGSMVLVAAWRTPITSVPAWPLLLGCLALLAGVFVPGARSEGVIDPRTGEDALVTRGQARAVLWGPVAMLAIAAAAVWTLGRG